MNPDSTLTLEEIEKARRYKSDGLSTQQVMARIARERLGGGELQLGAQTRQGVIGRVLRDIPSDIQETVQNVRDTSQRFGDKRNAIPGAEASTLSKVTAGALSPIAQTAAMAGDVVMGAAKTLTTPEFEAGLSQKVGETIAPATFRYGQFTENLDPQSRFTLQNIVEPGLGTMLDVGLPGAAGVATRGAARAAGSAIDAGTEAAAGALSQAGVRMPSRPPSIIETGITPEAKSAIVDAYTRSIKPNFNQLTSPQKQFAYQSNINTSLASIVANKQNLQFVDEATGETVTGRTPQNLKEYTEAIDQTKRAIFDEYNTIAEQAGEAGAFVDNVRVANALDEIIGSNRLRVSSPETIRYADELKQTLLRTPRLSVLEAQDIIADFNNQLSAFYSKASPDAFSQTAVKALVANQLRQAVDESISALDGALYQTIKSEYGALKAIERDVMRAYLRDARRNVKGLVDFTDIFSAGQVVSGVLAFNPAMIAQGVAQKAVAAGIKTLNDPNRAVKKMFEQMERYAPPQRAGRTPTRRALPAPAEGALRSEVGSGRIIPVPERDKILGVAERSRTGATRRSDSEPRMTEPERAIRADDEAVQQAVAEMEADMTGDTRTTVGDNKVQGADGGFYRFNELPSWVPEGFRDGALMSKVMENILSGKKPRANAGLEIELQDIVEKRIATRVDEIKKGKGDQGIFTGDAAFAAALMVGGSYFLMEDGEMLPIIAIGSMMANPVTRRAALASAKRAAEKGGKVPAPYKRKISEALEDYDAGFIDVKENGVRRSIAPDEVDQRIAELQEKNFSGTFTDKDALEAEELMANKGVFVDMDSPKAEGATPQTTALLEEARKYKSAEEFVESVFNKEPEYGMSHRPSWEGSPSAANLLEGDMLPRDVYKKPEWSIASGRTMSDPAVKESWDALMKIRNKPEAEITVWRATPKNELNIGDWVSFSKKYAEGEGAAEGTKAYPFKVKAKDVLFAGDDINEFGYFPRTQLEDIWKQANE